MQRLLVTRFKALSIAEQSKQLIQHVDTHPHIIDMLFGTDDDAKFTALMNAAKMCVTTKNARMLNRILTIAFVIPEMYDFGIQKPEAARMMSAHNLQHIVLGGLVYPEFMSAIPVDIRATRNGSWRRIGLKGHMQSLNAHNKPYVNVTATWSVLARDYLDVDATNLNIRFRTMDCFITSIDVPCVKVSVQKLLTNSFDLTEISLDRDTFAWTQNAEGAGAVLISSTPIDVATDVSVVLRQNRQDITTPFEFDHVLIGVNSLNQRQQVRNIKFHPTNTVIDITYLLKVPTTEFMNKLKKCHDNHQPSSSTRRR